MVNAELDEVLGPRALDEGQQALLTRKISELALIIPGTRLETLVNQLYKELEQSGIELRPQTYLADEWGCPDGVPAIGIPFYLAQPELHRLEGDLTGIDVEEEAEILMILRHEAGHAFNYAYRLYEENRWSELFGPISQPYLDDYRPVPFSADYVRHLPGWYAQKHPDEDFAETFAVWLTPQSNWRRDYDATAALAKLRYVDELARQFGRRAPMVMEGMRHGPVNEMTMTLREWYATSRKELHFRPKLHPVIDIDLRNLFPAVEGDSAANFLRSQSRRLIRDVSYWTGFAPEMLSSLLRALVEQVDLLGLKAKREEAASLTVSVSVFLATLAMNYMSHGRFVPASNGKNEHHA